MSIASWFVLGILTSIFMLNIWLTIKVGYKAHKIKKLEKKSNKSLDIKK